VFTVCQTNYQSGYVNC